MARVRTYDDYLAKWIREGPACTCGRGFSRSCPISRDLLTNLILEHVGIAEKNRVTVEDVEEHAAALLRVSALA